MKRYAVTDAQWEVIQPILPWRIAETVRAPSDPGLTLNEILWIFRTGALW
jgi:transposase